MRVTHLPYNTASLITHNVEAQRRLGVDARGLVIDAANVQTARGVRVLDNAPYPKYSPRWLLSRSKRLMAFLGVLGWSDLLHWYNGYPLLPGGLDLRLIQLFRMPGVTSWQGSDIRYPEAEWQENPYYRLSWAAGYEHHERRSRSIALQNAFAEAGLLPVCTPGMAQYIEKTIAPRYRVLQQGLSLGEYEPAFPDPDKDTPLIVHAPTAPISKGTPFVLKALDRLRERHPFEFRLVQGLSREDALRLIRDCDIFLDQFIVGDYGMAATEAMAFGKPVFGYIKETVAAAYPPELPVVNANPDNLASRLLPYLKDASLRSETGRRSRAYVEAHQDLAKIAEETLSVYRSLLPGRVD